MYLGSKPPIPAPEVTAHVPFGIYLASAWMRGPEKTGIKQIVLTLKPTLPWISLAMKQTE